MAGTAASGGRSTNAKSRRQHELDGTFRKDRHADLRTPEPTPGRPEPLGALDKDAQAAWEWLMWAFEDMGTLAKVDAAAATAFCRLWAKTVQVEARQEDTTASLAVLRENEGDLKELSASERQTYFTNVVMLEKLISKATDQSRSGWMAVRQYLVEFGLTSASRGRIKLPPKGEEVDEFAAFQLQRVK